MSQRPSPPNAGRVWGGAVLLFAGLALGAVIVLTGWGPFPIDDAWQGFLASSRIPPLTDVSYALNWLGGGWFGIVVLPVIVTLLLLMLRRPRGAVFFLVAELVSVGIVQATKHVVARPRPDDMIVASDFGSFPSGHVANAATIAVALCVLFPGVWVVVAGSAWTLLMAFSRTYLGAHWLTDTVGGALIGAGAVLLVAAAFARPLANEATRRAEPPG